MIESAVTVLPHPDSPTTPSVSPSSRAQGHSVDGSQISVAGAKLDAEVGDFEQGRHELSAVAVRRSTRGMTSSENARITSSRGSPGTA